MPQFKVRFTKELWHDYRRRSITIDESEVVFEACSRRDAHLVAHDLYSDLCQSTQQGEHGPLWIIHSVEPYSPAD